MTRRFGLVGHPLGHSLSRDYFERKFKELGLDAEYLNCDFPTINEAMEAIRQTSGLEGVNVTIPYKTAIIPFLDAIDEEAKGIQAVNTVKLERIANDIRMTGYNTDVTGFKNNILPLLRPHHTAALILGTGGAAKAAFHVFDQLGLPCMFVSRDLDKGDMTYDELNADVMAEHTVIVNCTPVGMFPKTDAKPEIPYEFVGSDHLLFDMVYNPIETAFIKAGKKRGAMVCNGLEMLYGQAEESWKIWNA